MPQFRKWGKAGGSELDGDAHKEQGQGAERSKQELYVQPPPSSTLTASLHRQVNSATDPLQPARQVGRSGHDVHTCSLPFLAVGRRVDTVTKA